MTIYGYKHLGTWLGCELHDDFLTINDGVPIANFINREECEKGCRSVQRGAAVA